MVIKVKRIQNMTVLKNLLKSRTWKENGVLFATYIKAKAPMAYS